MKIPLFPFILLAVICLGCDAGGPANNANTNAKPPGLPTATPVTNSNGSQGSNGNTSSVKDKPPAPPSPAAEKKEEEGLFSFPPPKVISATSIPSEKLLNREGPTTFGNISAKLERALKAGGYSTSEKFSYFWNSGDEFAIVTAMERIYADGTPFEYAERWNASKLLPQSPGFGGYRRDLIKGKKVFYRVFAFIVTRKNYNFYRNSSPSFAMAKEWMNKGVPVLDGDEESAAIQEAAFTGKDHCFALLYLFVNHTSLDDPVSVDQLPDDEQYLLTGLNTGADSHLVATNIVFGE